MIFEELYDTCYSAKGFTTNSEGDVIPVQIPLGHYACFGRVLRSIGTTYRAKITYRLYLAKENIDRHNYNLCTKEETKKILRCLQKVVNFSYKFSTDSYYTSEFNKAIQDYIVLIISVEGSKCQHIWLTTMLRCFYEYPYNVAAKETCELQSKLKVVDGIDFQKENWINLYLTIVSQLGSTEGHGIVYFGERNPKLRTYHDWKQKLEAMNPKEWVYKQLRDRSFSDKIKSFRITSQASYDEGIKKRAACYVAAYKDKLSWKK